jgi:hypothetical protein
VVINTYSSAYCPVGINLGLILLQTSPVERAPTFFGHYFVKTTLKMKYKLDADIL